MSPGGPGAVTWQPPRRADEYPPGVEMSNRYSGGSPGAGLTTVQRGPARGERCLVEHQQIISGAVMDSGQNERGGTMTEDRPSVAQPGRTAALPHETSLPGVFAAGDVRRGAVQRVASAVGDGAITIPLVHRYLAGSAMPEAAAR
jgi:hypothetical protein